MYLRLNKLDDATVACEKALELYKLTNNILSQGNIYHLFGCIYMSQDKINDAESSFMKASEFCTIANYPHGQGVAFGRLGHIYMSRGQLHDAKEMFEKAIIFHHKAQNSAHEKEDAEHLSVVLAQIEEGSSMK